MANLYYAEGLADGALKMGAIVEVTGDEAHHAVRVSRLRVGERILIGDGRGTIGEGEVESAERDRFSVRVDAVRAAEAPATRLVLVQALAKGDRDERAVEQATEFGVDEIVPWQAERSVSRWSGRGGSSGDNEKAAKGREKWARIAREAAKQSLRPRIPGVRALASLGDLCAEAGSADTEVLVLHPRGGRQLSEWTANRAFASGAEVHVVVGPEGGFSDAELDALEAAGAKILVLGETVLRTSSAGPAALAVLNVALGRW